MFEFYDDMQADENGFVIDGEKLVGYRGNEKMVVIPNGIVEIGRRAFMDKDIFSITLPKSLQRIEDDAFKNVHRLVEIVNLPGLDIIKRSTTYGDIAANARGVISKPEESGLIEEGDYVFYNEEGIYFLIAYLGNEPIVKLPKKIKDNDYMLARHAFMFTNTLSVTIPKNIMFIEKDVFKGCNNLVEIYNLSTMWEVNEKLDCLMVHFNEESASRIIKLGDFLFSNFAGQYKLIHYSGNDTEVELPNKIFNRDYTIGSKAFWNCKNIKKIYIPECICYIDEDAFKGCVNLEYNTYKNQSYLGSKEKPYLYFMRADNKDDVFYHLNEQTRLIYNYAFDLMLDEIDLIIPKSVKYIARDTFLSGNFNIYCEAYKKPETWDTEWNFKLTPSFLRNRRMPDYQNVYWYRKEKPKQEGNYWHFDDKGNNKLW